MDDSINTQQRGFGALSVAEQRAVKEFARAEYDGLIFQQPQGYVSRNAAADPEGWQQRLCETIARDPQRVRAILEASLRGFTLIELSIVLVVIGLIVGGVLVGQDLIRAAGERATISQIESYNTAANTFRDKYGCLPGDITPAMATQFNLPTGTAGHSRLGVAGMGDCNGIIQGYSTSLGAMLDWSLAGEPAMFFEDLSTTHLVDGGFDTYDPVTSMGSSASAAPLTRKWMMEYPPQDAFKQCFWGLISPLTAALLSGHQTQVRPRLQPALIRPQTNIRSPKTTAQM